MAGSSAATTDAARQERTTVVSIITASSLMVLMLGVGIAASSLGLISTGIESTGDVVAAVVTFFAVRLGARPADESHPFGHRRAENLSALAEASILLGGGLLVVIEAVQRLIGGGSSLSARWYVFAVISLAIVVNILRAVVASASAKRYGSAALRSNSFHFASDVGGSVAVLVGLIVVRAGFHDGDAISALVVAAFIFTAAGRLIFENAQILMDTAPLRAQAVARDARSPPSALTSSSIACACASPAVATSPTWWSPSHPAKPWSRPTPPPARWKRRSSTCCPTATSSSMSSPAFRV